MEPGYEIESRAYFSTHGTCQESLEGSARSTWNQRFVRWCNVTSPRESPFISTAQNYIFKIKVSQKNVSFRNNNNWYLSGMVWLWRTWYPTNTHKIPPNAGSSRTRFVLGEVDGWFLPLIRILVICASNSFFTVVSPDKHGISGASLQLLHWS